jgi:hypothetical protein
MSQIPSNAGLKFKNPIVRPGANFKMNFKPRRPILLSSPEGEPDSYTYDSFCVPDEDVEEIVEESDEDL